MITVTVCGSFRRHMSAIYQAVQSLSDLGAQVLSPSDPRIVDSIGDFVFVASDRGRSMKLVEDRHLAAIGASDFVWLVAPDGYVGPSATLELGYALASSVPVYCSTPICDQTLNMYVRYVTSLEKCVKYSEAHARSAKEEARGQFLLDPEHYGNAFLQRTEANLKAVSDIRTVMSKTHTASTVEPMYASLKHDLSRLLLPHD